MKVCIICGKEKPLTEFYTHKAMADGHLSKCKDCIKAAAKRNYARKSEDPAWVEKERQRGRDKAKRLGYRYNSIKTRSICKESSNLLRKLRRRGYKTAGLEAHHWNYNEPNSVFLLTRKAHRRIHQAITVNYDDKFCYTLDGVRIETAEQARKIFFAILKESGISENLELVTINNDLRHERNVK